MQKRLEAIFQIDKGETLKTIVADYGVRISTVCECVLSYKNRTHIEDFCAKMVTKDSLGNRSTTRKAKNESLDDALFLWFTQEREHGVLISVPIIQEKALSLNRKLGGDPLFTASVGWLGRWKDRHGIRQVTVIGELLSGDANASESYKKTFEKLVADEKLSPSQVTMPMRWDCFIKCYPKNH